ncbi:MAG: nucleotidyltransferase family protein [Acidobacteriota bacterium]|jgi:molybdenum cofactor cytidylyltransferase|nr:nucleotidyltransferase family protein [Acidobacteriota bacterium]
MDEINKENIGIIILAAGASTRFGKPKQLLEFEKQTLLERIAENALETGSEIIVVLGANAEKIGESVENLSVEIVVNEDWQSGMSSSLVEGLRKMIEIKNNLQAVIILLCDQPFIDENTILKLIEAQKSTNQMIVASRYAETIGVPALFRRDVFDELLDLNKEIGAKSIIEKYAETDLATISVPEAEFDIDTEADFEQLVKSL